MLKRGFKQMMAEANAAIETISVQDALALLGHPNTVFVDVREKIETAQTGLIAGAVHSPRGFLEFQADPDSPAYNPALREDQRLVLYCASGGRSALAAKTLVDMGFENVCHIAGGFTAWSQSGGPVDAPA